MRGPLARELSFNLSSFRSSRNSPKREAMNTLIGFSAMLVSTFIEAIALHCADGNFQLSGPDNGDEGDVSIHRDVLVRQKPYCFVVMGRHDADR